MHLLRRAAGAALLVALIVPGSSLAGQATVHLAPSDPVYRDLERVTQWGLVDTVLVGRRPWSRMQAARVAAQALRNRDRLADDPALAATAGRLLDRIATRLAPELASLDAAGHPSPEGPLPRLDLARIDATWSDSPARPVPSNDVALTQAVLNPLLAYEEGRGSVEGAAGGLEVSVRGRLGGALAYAVRPRVRATVSGGEVADEREVTLHNAHARLVLGNAALTVGRDHLLWGPGADGGLLLSRNPAALTLASLENEAPLTLPWILGRLGPSRHQVFYADLGTEGRAFPHAYLFGLRSSFLPHPRVELGVGLLTQAGGEGAPEASLGERILDHLFLPDLFVDREFLFSQKMAGFDVLVRLPEARGMELYVEGVLDDIDVDRFRSMVWEDGGWLVGVRVARLDDAGRWGLRLEGEHTGIRFYRHQDFTGGVTLERRILGSELGPDGDALRARVTWEPDAVNAFALDAAWERRSNDHYVLIEGEPYYFARTRILPEEVRRRLVATWEQRRRDPGAWRVTLQAGYEHADHFAFARSDTRHNLLARLVVEVRPR